MKKIILAVLFISVIQSTRAQWQPINASSTDINTIYHTGGKVGIGTSTPGNLLTVQGTGAVGTTFQQKITNGTQSLSLGANSTAAEVQSQGSVPLFLNYGGNNTILNATSGSVGIGTTTPKAILDVGSFIPNGTLGTVFGRLAEGNTTGSGTFLGVKGYGTQETDYGGNSFAIEHSFYGAVNSSINFHRGNSTTGGYLTFNTNTNVERVRITRYGDVGIGTSVPDAKLAVKGDIHANEVRVDLFGAIAPDYVFEQSYKLPSLAEIQRYINQNKHLPEVPSAKEMDENGMNLKEMNLLLLKKVEEITLYLIELKKDNDSLKNENEILSKRIDEIASKK